MGVGLAVVALVMTVALVVLWSVADRSRRAGPSATPDATLIDAHVAAFSFPPTTRDSTSLIIAGDIARCSELHGARGTAELVLRMPGMVMTAGDNAYDQGSIRDFDECYAPTWGRFLDRTRPVPGNHDYDTHGAAGYFDYFGERAGPSGRGYYAFDAGTWRIIALSSEPCIEDTCGPGSEQHAWLVAELASAVPECSLAVMHHPPFSSGDHGDTVEVRPLVELLFEAGTEVIVAGHDHDYERLGPARPDGRPDAENGIRQFVVGTGGARLRPVDGPPADHSEVFDATTHGVLRFRLHDRGYDWQFIPVVDGTFTDAGSGNCHGAPGESP